MHVKSWSKASMDALDQFLTFVMADSYRKMDWLGLLWQAMARSKTPALTTSNISKQRSLDVT